MSGRRYELRVIYTIDVADPDLVMETAYQVSGLRLTQVLVVAQDNHRPLPCRELPYRVPEVLRASGDATTRPTS